MKPQPTFIYSFTYSVAAGAILFASATTATAQSSSLYELDAQQIATEQLQVGDELAEDRMAPAIRNLSLLAVEEPEPRVFQKHDLVTIVVSESTTADISASLETEKETKVEGRIQALPALDPASIAAGNLRQNSFAGGNPEVDVEFGKSFEGEGDYARRDQFTTRITAEIIDIKPNGNLVVEARKYIRTEKESLKMTLTGTCRPDDIGIDNTVLSTRLYDLHVTKDHEGEIKKSTKKGVLTKVFDAIFAF